MELYILIYIFSATLAQAIEVEKRKTKATSESEDAAASEEIKKRRRFKNQKYRDDSISPPPTFKQTIQCSPQDLASGDNSSSNSIVPEQNQDRSGIYVREEVFVACSSVNVLFL